MQNSMYFPFNRNTLRRKFLDFTKKFSLEHQQCSFFAVKCFALENYQQLIILIDILFLRVISLLAVVLSLIKTEKKKKEEIKN